MALLLALTATTEKPRTTVVFLGVAVVPVARDQ
jgi:hypothetical protein